MKKVVWALAAILSAAMVGPAKGEGFTRTDIDRILAQPEGYLRTTVTISGRFRGMESAYPLFQTHFNPDLYAAFSIWPEGTRLWRDDAEKRVFPFLFVKKGKLYETIRSLKKYQKVTIRGIVRAVADGKPCIEAVKIKYRKRVSINDEILRRFKRAIAEVEDNPRFTLDEVSLLYDKKLPPLLQAGMKKFMGRALFLLGQSRKAVECYSEAVKTLKEDAQLWWWKGMAECQAGDGKAAVASLRNASRLDPDDGIIRSTLAVALQMVGKGEEAVAQCRAAARLASRSTTVFWNYASILVDQKRFAEAAAMLMKAHKFDRKNLMVIKKLGEVNLQMKQWKEALSWYDKALKLTDADAEIYFGRGKAYTMGERYEEARNAFVKAVRLAPENIDYRLELGRFYMDREAYIAAAKCYREVTKMDPDNMEAWFNLGLIAKKDFAWDEAVKCFLKVHRLDPKRAAPLKHLVDCYTAKGNTERVIWALEKVVSLEPENHRLRHKLAKLLMMKKNYREAIAHLSVCVKQKPLNVEYWLDAAVTYEHLGYERDAEKAYRKVLSLDPDAAVAYNNLACMYIRSGNRRKYPEVLRLATKAHELTPDDPAVQDTRGWAMFLNGRKEEALEFLLASYKKKPVPEAAYHVGAVMMELGRIDEAKRYLNEALNAKERPYWYRDARWRYRKVERMIRDRERRKAREKKRALRMKKKLLPEKKPAKQPVTLTVPAAKHEVKKSRKKSPSLDTDTEDIGRRKR